MKTPHIGLLILALAGTTSQAQTLTDSSLTLTQIVSGLDQPIGLEFLATNDLLVLEKANGQVRRVIDGVIQVNPVLDLAVDSSDERGILSILKHPGFATNNFIYICSTPNGTADDTIGTTPTCICVERYEWDGSALINPVAIFSFTTLQGIDYHNGGAMAFGPDGKLYIVTGDHEQFGLLQNQPGFIVDDTSVILRLNDDGTPAPGNPLAAEGSSYTNYFAYGVRNSFGLAFDPVTGNLWDTENGEANYDEINLIAPGFNSGWRRIMGPLSRTPGGTNSLFLAAGSQYADPKFSWLTTVAPTGIAFLNSTALGAAYENDLFVSDFNNGQLYHFDLNPARNALVLSGGLSDTVADNDTERDAPVIGTGFNGGFFESGIAALKVGPDGKLYVVSLVQGKIFAIAAAGASAAVHDLAVVSLKAPKKISLKGTPVIKPVKIAIQNLGNQTKTIADATALLNLINLTIETLGGCPAPTTALVPPKTVFPVVLAPKKKLSISINVTFDCVNDGTTGVGHEDFRYTINLSADDVPANNDCPRAASGTDKGCAKGVTVFTDVAGAQ
ncbi:MAG: PQQ-dependent sugar dehydrogenase [Verrucomicrobiota bacterium]